MWNICAGVVGTQTWREEALKLQESRFKGGLANEMDVARARTELELARNDLASLERQRGNAENALAVLCGQLPSTFKLSHNAALPSPPRVPGGLPSTLLQRRPAASCTSGDQCQAGETCRGLDPSQADTDGDGVYDLFETLRYQTDPKLADTDGDGKADLRKTLYHGFVEGNQQHRVNGLRWGLDGWLYLANGDSGGEIAGTGYVPGHTSNEQASGGRQPTGAWSVRPL